MTGARTCHTVAVLLGNLLKLQILTTDERTLTGTLMCVDHFGNLLVYDAVEEMKVGKRVLNQIIISLDKLKAVSVLVCFQCPGRFCQCVMPASPSRPQCCLLCQAQSTRRPQNRSIKVSQ